MLPDMSAAISYVRERVADTEIELAVILGSGLGEVAGAGRPLETIDYASIPGFPSGAVEGHSGRLVLGEVSGQRVLFFQGRFHLYQGLSANQVVAPVLLAAALGCSQILLTNASGGIDPDFAPGDLVLIRDHLNLTGENPLTGITPPPFLDLCDLYDTNRYPDLHACLGELGVRLHQGVLAALAGPSYETPAEIRMLRQLGADVVSMSTVHEAIAARHAGMRVSAISVVANPAAGLATPPLDHHDVLSASARSVTALRAILPILLPPAKMA